MICVNTTRYILFGTAALNHIFFIFAHISVSITGFLPEVPGGASELSCLAGRRRKDCTVRAACAAAQKSSSKQPVWQNSQTDLEKQETFAKFECVATRMGS